MNLFDLGRRLAKDAHVNRYAKERTVSNRDNLELRGGSGELLSGWIAKYADGRAYLFRAEGDLNEVVHKAMVRSSRDTGRGADGLVSVFLLITLFEQHRSKGHRIDEPEGR